MAQSNWEADKMYVLNFSSWLVSFPSFCSYIWSAQSTCRNKKKEIDIFECYALPFFVEAIWETGYYILRNLLFDSRLGFSPTFSSSVISAIYQPRRTSSFVYIHTVNLISLKWLRYWSYFCFLALFARLDVYIHDYLLKRKLHNSAKTFMTEGKVATDPVGNTYTNSWHLMV